jgi:predicted dehydrogenase
MSQESAVKVGIIGCGAISNAYLKNFPRHPILEVIALSDLDMERAKAKAAEFNIPRVYTPSELLADPEIDLVINLTIPKAHAQVSLEAIEAGKSVYSEKPLAITRAEGKQLLETAARHNVRLGCAPDTFLGGGLQTCRKLIDDGWIGEPIAATAFMVGHGHEHWHPDPAFYYQMGGGPLFDMGPYYLTALVHLLGPVEGVSGTARTTFKERLVTSQPRYGERIVVKTPTHVAGQLEFHSGAVATMIMSFDVWDAELPRIEIYGTEGSLSVPDPNTFGGPVRLKRYRQEWREMPLTHGYTDNSRGLGAADMAHSLRSHRPHRASAELALHVLDIMVSTLESAEAGRRLELHSRCERPAPLPLGPLEGRLAG